MEETRAFRALYGQVFKGFGFVCFFVLRLLGLKGLSVKGFRVLSGLGLKAFSIYLRRVEPRPCSDYLKHRVH